MTRRRAIVLAFVAAVALAAIAAVALWGPRCDDRARERRGLYIGTVLKLVGC